MNIYSETINEIQNDCFACVNSIALESKFVYKFKTNAFLNLTASTIIVDRIDHIEAQSFNGMTSSVLTLGKNLKSINIDADAFVSIGTGNVINVSSVLFNSVIFQTAYANKSNPITINLI